MKTVHKLILKSYLGPMILTFLIVMFILVLQFLWVYIDDLIGKGISMNVILELMYYAGLTLIPMALPLATLLAAIMTMGNLGENYELLALKSAGLSLPRILRPLMVVVGIVAFGSYFVANNLAPYAFQKMHALLYDVRSQKHTFEFKDGIFFNGIDNICIRVGKQNPNTKLLTDILIYDNKEQNGNMVTTIADSGYISLSDDKRYLLVTLYNGTSYENNRNFTEWLQHSTLNQKGFHVQNGIIPLTGYDFSRTDASYIDNAATKSSKQLRIDIDSLRQVSELVIHSSYAPLLESSIFPHDLSIIYDSLSKPIGKGSFDVLAKMPEVDLDLKKDLYERAIRSAENARNSYSYDETNSKDTIALLYNHEIEWHKKLSLPVSIMIFFLIGAPLGAIIRKGGLGMPTVISVIFFVIYYIIMMSGMKMAREGTWTPLYGTWISSLILLPISIYLTYKASHDSNLLNSEWYYMQFNRLKIFLSQLKQKKTNDNEIKHSK